MNPFDAVLRRLFQGSAAVQVLLGLAFWMGYALPLIPLHMVVGLVFVLSLWLLALRAALAGAGRGLAALTALYGAFVVAFGMAQAQILPGEHHWVIRLLHLVIGIGAMGLADVLWRGIRHRAEAGAPLPAV